MDKEPAGGLRSAVLKGAAWSVVLRWSMRLLGLVSTFILARLLTPADFGLVAMGMLVVGFVEAWLYFGLDTALIQNQRATREHYDTAWTLRLLQSVVVAAGVAFAAPYAAKYFNEPRVVPVIWTLCLVLPISASGNIGVIAFRKDLAFDKEFKLNVTGKLLGFFVTIGAALWLRNYWALVIGTLGGAAFGCVLSYVMHAYRPWFSLAKVRELWSFSQWMLVRSLGHFAEMKADETIVGGMGSAREMGLYSVASELGRLPGSEIAAPLNQALVPGFAKLQEEPGRLAAAYLNVLGTVSAVTLPASIGLALVAKEAVLVLMGPQWLEAVPLLTLLAISGAIRTGESLSASLLLGTGRPAISAAMSWISGALLIGFALLLIAEHGVLGVAIARVVAGVVVMIIVFSVICRIADIRPVALGQRLWRPLVASLGMAVLVSAIPESGSGALADLALKVSAGALTYGIALLALWHISGRPSGAERMVLDQIARLAARAIRRRN